MADASLSGERKKVVRDPGLGANVLASGHWRSGDELGQLLEGCRQYLVLIAEEVLDGDIRAKVGASDLVQETFFEAQKDIHTFRGASRDELLAWLRQILLYRLSKLYRRYRRTQKRALDREWRGPQASADFLEQIFDSDQTSPSGYAVRVEQIELVQRALARLPADYRQVVLLRHRDRLKFSQIAKKLRRSPDAIRMLWYRAIDRMARELEVGHEQEPG